MLAICSDLDETPDRHVYWSIMRFLNTTEETAMGQGVGLEVGNSIYFDMPPGQFAYWNTDDTGREMVRTLIRSGYIDCLHSYGDLAETRECASRAVDELERYNCRLEVWVDHRKSPTNFGPDITCGYGDIASSRAYHADISIAFGIKYIWRGRTTGLLGQNAAVHPLLFVRMFERASPLVSGRTLAKEAVKVFLGHVKHPRWQMHASNSVYRISRLRDGHLVYEFLRADPYFGGQSSVDTGDLIGHVLTKRNLDMLVRRKAVWIHYTHLGKVKNSSIPFGEPTQKAFRLLASYYSDGRILVTTTHRLLRYLTMRDCIQYRAENKGDVLIITIDTVDDPIRGIRVPSLEELQGITFEVEGKRATKVRLSSSPINVNSKVEHSSGKTYVSIPWQPLVFPKVDLRKGFVDFT